MNLPNSITLARIAVIPVFLVLAFRESTAGSVAALVVFSVASASDSLDGYVARRWGTTSRAGQFLDPLADKLLIGSALVALVATRPFPLWAALVIAAREVAVQALRTRITGGGGTLPASPVAKAKTTLQIAMVWWWLLPWAVSLWHWLLIAAAVFATVWSGLEYFLRAGRPQEAPS